MSFLGPFRLIYFSPQYRFSSAVSLHVIFLLDTRHCKFYLVQCLIFLMPINYLEFCFENMVKLGTINQEVLSFGVLLLGFFYYIHLHNVLLPTVSNYKLHFLSFPVPPSDLILVGYIILVFAIISLKIFTSYLIYQVSVIFFFLARKSTLGKFIFGYSSFNTMISSCISYFRRICRQGPG